MRGVAGEEYPIGRELFNSTYTFDTAPVHAIDISQERVDETAKREHDCNKCENRGRVLGDSQESYCENCIYGSPWKKDYYKEKNA
jgi:hypothetical protein